MCMCVTVVIESVILGILQYARSFVRFSFLFFHFQLLILWHILVNMWKQNWELVHGQSWLTAQQAWRMECLHSRCFGRKSAAFPRVHGNSLFPHHGERSSIVSHHPNTKDSICSDRSNSFLHYWSGAQLILHRELIRHETQLNDSTQ